MLLSKIDKVLKIILYLIILVTPFSIAGAFILSGIIFFIWVVRLFISRDFSFLKERFNKLLIIFISYILLSSIWSYRATLVYDEFVGNVLPYIVVFFVIITVIKKEREIKNILVLFLLSNVINSIISLYLSTKVYRVEGFTHSPNRLADIFLMLIIVSMSIVLFERNIGWRITGLFSLFLGFGGIIVTYSRGGWISLLAAIFVIAVIHSRKALIILMVLLLIIPIFLPNEIINRAKSITDLDKRANKERILMWQSAINMFIDHPIIGIGYHNIRYLYEEYRSIEATEKFHVQLHNIYLNILAELGIIGLLIFLSLVIYISKITFDLLKKGKISIIIAFAGILAGMLVHGLVDFTIRAIEVGLIFTYFPAIVFTIYRHDLFIDKQEVF